MSNNVNNPTEGTKTSNYRLRVSAGPEYDVKTHQIVPVNSDKTLRFENEYASVNLCMRIQGYTGLPNGSPLTSEYFSHPLHTKDQYSICFSFVPKDDICGNDLVFGNDFDRPIRESIPPGFNTALNIVKWAIDPALEGDAYADKPYMYSPGVASWNYFRIGEIVCDDKTKDTVDIHSDVVEEGAEGSGIEVRKKMKIPDDPGHRRKHFLSEDVRKDFVFEKGREYLVDFGNPYLGFNDFSLRLPGFHLHVIKYISERNHKLRYTLKNKKTNQTILVVLLTLLLHDTEEEIRERSSPITDSSDEEERASQKYDKEEQHSPQPDDVD
ncbi:hypothetical protein BGW36DRAFT_459951 [Talaromyces proteolyticus]|uniref:Domain of unknown function at the cortex 1 domain-containing protein n=1 Tax=Talaromyces proteolyticus TaxID=1131652 RepID=A0AAD4KX67_9EURO|nr:uncharacterized protein BGW36DRAFT_459951 [Talaromyces proteolyticus]KAH8700847.1 hypothetical protein BGW36DRAFT_459951 [Talaromyces proteolyticus]